MNKLKYTIYFLIFGIATLTANQTQAVYLVAGRKKFRFGLFLIFAVFFFGLAIASPTFAATCNDQADGNWNSAATWDCGIVPDADDDVTIDSHTVTMTADSLSNTVTISGGTLSSGNYKIITKDFVQTGGTVSMGSGAMKVAGDFTRMGGIFTAGTSVVSLVGVDQTIDVTGAPTTFYKLYKLTNSADTLTITAGNELMIASGGVMRFWGKPESKTLSIVSSSPGTSYTITRMGTAELEYTDWSDATWSASQTVAASSLGTGNTNLTVTKEFISTIRATGGDYSSLSSWESANQTDLTATTTKVFSHGGITGTIADTDTITGSTSGATANVVHATTTQILLESISGTFQSGEQVQVDASNLVTISDAGFGAISTAECYNDWPSGLVEDYVSISGWTTGKNNYVKVYTPQGQRHNGVLKNESGNYTGFTIKQTNYSGKTSVFGNEQNYTIIDGIIIVAAESQVSYGISSEVAYSTVSNNIVYREVGTGQQGIRFYTTASVGSYIFNNIVYGSDSNNWEICFMGCKGEVYNNVAYECDYGFVNYSTYDNELTNNSAFNNNIYDFGGSVNAIISNSISSDGTADDFGGSDNIVDATLADLDFVSTTSGLEDLHIETDSVARNEGLDLSVDPDYPLVSDIDGDSMLGFAEWSIGADQYSDFDYSSLSPTDGNKSVAVGADFVMNFSESVTAQAGKYIYIKREDDDSTVFAIEADDTTQVSGSGTVQITVNPAENLEAGTKYYVTMDRSCFINVYLHQNAVISDSIEWNFQTASFDWHDKSWTKRKKITIDEGEVSGGQTDFPVLLSVTDTDFKDHAQTDGNDFFLTDTAGNQLPHEIESYTASTGELVLWFKASYLYDTSDTHFYVYYGNSLADDQQDAENVWDENYKMVQHMDDTTTSTITDSTANDNDGTKYAVNEPAAGTGLLADGLVGKAQDFDVVDDVVNCGSGASIDDIFAGGGTVQFIMKPQGWGEFEYGRVLDKGPDASNLTSTQFYISSNGDLLFTKSFSTTNGVWGPGSDTISLNNIYFCSLVYDSDSVTNNPIMYLNGSDATALAAATPSGSATSDAGNDLFLGARGTDREFDGLIDEVKFLSTELSADWISTEYNNQSAPGDFLSLSAEESSGAESSAGQDGGVSSDGLVGYWSFDGSDISGTTVYDRSGQGNNGTLTNGPTPALGKLGQGMSFDDTNDYVNIGNISALKPAFPFSVSFWSKRTIGSGVVFSTGPANMGASGYRGWMIYDGGDFRGGDGSGVGIGDRFGRNVLVNPGIDGIWHYKTIVVTSSTNINLYLDGELNNGAYTNGTASSLGYGSDRVLIGASDDGGTPENFFGGFVDEVRVYNRALSANEISGLYNSGQAKFQTSDNENNLSDGLVGYWPFDGSDISGTNAYDRSGNGNNGTLTNDPIPALGKLGQALSFDGMDDYVLVPNSSEIHPVNELTIGAWVNQNNNATSPYQRITEKNDDLTCWINDNNGDVCVRLSANKNGEASQTCFEADISQNRWYHLFFTYKSDESVVSLYIDGELFDTSSYYYGLLTTNTNALYIGNKSSIDRSWMGQIDEVRIYDRALSAVEISQLYNMGRVEITN